MPSPASLGIKTIEQANPWLESNTCPATTLASASKPPNGTGLVRGYFGIAYNQNHAIVTVSREHWQFFQLGNEIPTMG